MSRVTADRWADVRRRLHARGLRWTPQRRVVLDVLASVDGHVTGAELVADCRAVDPATTPSTVYRTLDVLEELGIVSHSHGLEGRQEYHVRPLVTHGHVACSDCGTSWELTAEEAEPVLRTLREGRGFEVVLDHLTIVGRCRDCAAI